MSIAGEIERITSAKDNIRTAIIAKGGTVSSDALIDTYPAAISAIPAGGGSTTYYQCASVGADTWTGNQLIPFSGGVLYPDMSSSASLSFTGIRTPLTGSCYTSDATILVAPPMVLGLAHFDGNTSNVVGASYSFSDVGSYTTGEFSSAAVTSYTDYISTTITTKDLRGDFTIDLWVNTPYVGTEEEWDDTDRCVPFAAATDCWIGIDNHQGHWNAWAGDGSGWTIMQADYEDYESDGVGTIPVTANTWTHLAYVHAADTYYLFVNGSQSVSRTIPRTIGNHYPTSSQAIRLGVWGGNAFGAQVSVDEFCVRNYAVWTSTFTPPTAPYAPVN